MTEVMEAQVINASAFNETSPGLFERVWLYWRVPNINWFMSVPVLDDGSAGVSDVELKPGSYVRLRAECNALAVLSNCPQMHNPCNGYNPTPIEVSVR